MTTIGGVAFRHLDRLPRVGDRISIEDISITVLEMDEHRIARVRASRGSRGDEVVAAGALAEPATTDAATEAAAEKQGNALHDDNKVAPTGDEGATGSSQPVNDDACPGPVESGDADSNPDQKAVH